MSIVAKPSPISATAKLLLNNRVVFIVHNIVFGSSAVNSYAAGSPVRSSRRHRRTAVRPSSVRSDLSQCGTCACHTGAHRPSSSSRRRRAAPAARAPLTSHRSRLRPARSTRARRRRRQTVPASSPRRQDLRRHLRSPSCRLPQRPTVTVKSSRDVDRIGRGLTEPARWPAGTYRDQLHNAYIGTNPSIKQLLPNKCLNTILHHILQNILLRLESRPHGTLV